MRSQPSVFVNCDECDTEREVLLEGRGTPDQQVNEYLKELGWDVDMEDICEVCKEKLNETHSSIR